MTVVDAHLHVWDLTRSPYRWLGPAPAALHRSFSPQEAAQRLRAAGIGRAVLVQADDTAADTRYLLEVAAAEEFVLGVVGWVALDDPGLAARQLDEFAGSALRGLRHLVHDDPRADFLHLPGVRRSLREAARRGLVLDVPDAWPRHLDAVADLADALPELTVVVDHLAKPPRGTTAMAAWESALRAAAARPNTRAKLSGLQHPVEPLTAVALRPVLHTALEAFGADRLMYGGDWPMTVPHGDYARTWEVVGELLGELTADERDRVLGATALQTYGGEDRA